ncbi:MAG TPA: ribosome small subunit-dependent GTPase A [Kofleriaceae bacterium]|nr:ribosome small subunit-dependent GTPase A [Kofleriaceae bacterium]
MRNLEDPSDLVSSVTLDSLGFGPYFTAQQALLGRPELVPARIAGESPGCYQLLGCRPALGELSGRLHADLTGLARPAVGDWVAIADSGGDRAIIHHVFDRRTAMVRRAAGRTGAPQIIAANVDCVLVVTSANRELNRRRLERYLSAIWDSGAEPVILLNKIDLAGPGEVEEMIASVEQIALGVSVLPVSAVTGAGCDALRSHVMPGRTAGLVGSSGVGKSSLINHLLGRDALRAAPIDGEDRGRHTTTRRELIATPTCGVLIDTPGMRELGLAGDDGGLEASFADIAALAGDCRFRDCAHGGEPGCAVEGAAGSGALDPARLAGYRKLVREIAAGERRRDPVAAEKDRRKWRAIHMAHRARSKVDPKHRR